MIRAAGMEVTVEGASAEEFGAIVADNRARAFAFLLQMVGNRDDAMDLLQEGFLRLHLKWHMRDPERPLGPWMFQIFRNLAIDHLRKRSRRQVYELDPERHASPSGRSRPLLKIQLWKAVNALPEEQREVFVLRELHGLSYAEIAEVTGSPASAVTMRLHHARQKLRRELREYL